MTAIEYLRQINGLNYKCYSRIYTYFFARLEKNMPKQNTTLNIKHVIDCINEFGIVQRQYYEDDYSKVNDDISETLIHIGMENFSDSIIVYNLPVNINILKQKITSSPIVVIISCTLEELNSEKSVIESEKIKGQKIHHAVCLVGYDEDREYFKFQNSYGDTWKYKGFGKIRFDALNKIKRAFSFQMIIL